MKVKRISLANFRGASKKITINFDTTKSLSLIFGENGTGKSTIIDAFDFVCNKNFGSLDNFSINKSANKYIATYGKKPSESIVELECETKKWKAVLSGTSIITSPPDVPDAYILRRPAILKLIEQQPSKRFDELKSFINVPFTEKTENSLRDAIKETQKLFDEYSRSLLQANDTLESLWVQSGKKGISSSEWAGDQIKIDITNKKIIVDAINFIFSSIADVGNRANLLNIAQEDEVVATKNIEIIEARKKKLEENQRGQDLELLSLLQEAQKYLANRSDINKCPVCGSAQDIELLSLNITSRIQSMKEAEVLSSEIKNAHDILKSKQTSKFQREKDFVEGLKRLIEYVNKSLPNEIEMAIHSPSEFLNGMICTTDFSPSLFNLFSSWHNDFQNSYKNQLENIKLDMQKAINLHDTIREQFNIVVSKKEQAKIKEKSLADLKNVLMVIEGERKDYIEKILMDISHEVSRLYAELHPNEEIGKPRFYLKPNVKSSLEFDAAFYDAIEIPPQAYYSESHLDTLGICTFIALAKHYKTESSILILDDVLTSVDAQHMDRFMKMLHNQSSFFNQIVVTTHYRPWKDRYKFARSSISNINVIELKPWSLINGIQISEFKQALTELKESSQLENSDRQIIASKAGIVLESILDFITLKYKCSLPRNGRNEYTLGELVGGIDSKLSKLLKIKKDGKEIELKPKLEAAIGGQWIRNQVGCHFNLSGADITDSDIQNFSTSVVEISEILLCPKCMSLPKKNTGSFWSCGCKENSLELYPLTQPGIDPKIDDDV
jgi:ABC-type transport system involved in cytochrome c biogenesis ATPase subunit